MLIDVTVRENPLGIFESCRPITGILCTLDGFSCKNITGLSLFSVYLSLRNLVSKLKETTASFHSHG